MPILRGRNRAPNSRGYSSNSFCSMGCTGRGALRAAAGPREVREGTIVSWGMIEFRRKAGAWNRAHPNGINERPRPMNHVNDEIRRARVHLAAANRLAVHDDLEEGIDKQ